MHFGRASTADEREKEAELIACLEAHADEVQHLYLLGDVFDGFMEYRHLVPKGFVRFQGLLARWTDRGIPVTYVLGNHDSWHRDYFEKELQVKLVPDAIDVRHGSIRLHLAHGDATASTHGLYSWLRPILRHPAALWLYQSLLPADVGLGLARRVSKALHDEDPDPAVVSALEGHARARLRQHSVDVVVMGHSHQPAVHEWSDGVYVNTGNWYEKRTFARLEDDRIRLSRWNGTQTLDIEACNVPK